LHRLKEVVPDEKLSARTLSTGATIPGDKLSARPMHLTAVGLIINRKEQLTFRTQYFNIARQWDSYGTSCISDNGITTIDFLVRTAAVL
jgi:hypothetical protein